MKIRTRLLVFNILVMAVAVLTLGGTFFVFGEQYLHHVAIDQISRSSRQTLVVVESFFDTRIAEQKTLAKSTFFFRKLDYDQIQARFEDYRQYYQTYQSISFFDVGRVRKIDLNRLDLEVKSDANSLFDRAAKADGPVYEFDTSKPLRPLVRFLTKVQYRNQPPVGFVMATVPLTNLQRTLLTLANTVAAQSHADVQLFSREGSRVYSRLQTEGTVTDSGPNEPLGLLAKPVILDDGGILYETADYFTIIFERNNEKRPKNSWKLAFRVAKHDLERPIVLLRKMMVSIFFALLLVAMALNRWLTQSMLLPLENLTASMQSYNLGRVDTTIDDLERDDEIGVLTRGVHDLTERMKRNFAELSTTSKFVALGEMAAGIAHEINNPLTVIMGKAALLEKAGPSPDATLVNDSSIKIIEMVHRVTRTIHALRVYSRSGETDAVGVESVESIINSTLDICLERLRLASIQIDISIDPIDAMITARPVQISQILMNLLNNAHDAIVTADREGGLPASEKWIRLIVLETATHVSIAVENGGPRIPDAVAARLFEPFFTTKPVGVGTGLGLMISRRLANANGSDLRFESSSPHTRFELAFPRPDLELLQPSLN
jgi:signal transduction histidine kinase